MNDETMREYMKAPNVADESWIGKKTILAVDPETGQVREYKEGEEPPVQPWERGGIYTIESVTSGDDSLKVEDEQ